MASTGRGRSPCPTRVRGKRQTVTTAGIPLTAGERVIRVVLDTATPGGGVGNYNWFRLVESTSSNPTTP
jgi:hypothetical protein